MSDRGNKIDSWRRVVVYGLGLSGRAAAGLLVERGVEVIGVDGRPVESIDLGPLADDPKFMLRAGTEPEGLPAAVDAVVVSPGVPPDRPLLRAARDGSVPVLAEVELAFLLLTGTVVAITGSNGKSTTTALTGALLEACGFDVAVCGNIGLPLSSCVADSAQGATERVFVTELSSFQLESVDTFRPRAAALLNLSPDHLDRHGTPEAYLRAKERVFARQDVEDVAVLNADDPIVAAVAVAARRRYFSRLREVRDGCYLDGDRIVERSPGQPDRELFSRSDLRLRGAHNLENAMAAMLLARSLGADPEGLRRGLQSFEGLPHRLQWVSEFDGVSWFDDSKGTNLGATAMSLEGFDDRTVHLIAGGRNKGADLTQLADVVRRKAVHLYLIGEAAAELDDALGELVPADGCGTLDVAVERAASRAVAGESVVLSPACASFDQFRSFVERGETFQRLVRALPELQASSATASEERVDG